MGIRVWTQGIVLNDAETADKDPPHNIVGVCVCLAIPRTCSSKTVSSFLIFPITAFGPEGGFRFYYFPSDPPQYYVDHALIHPDDKGRTKVTVVTHHRTILRACRGGGGGG